LESKRLLPASTAGLFQDLRLWTGGGSDLGDAAVSVDRIDLSARMISG
jgi:hypothetical protein